MTTPTKPTKLEVLRARLSAFSEQHGLCYDKYAGDADAVRVMVHFSRIFVEIFGAQLGSDAEYEFYYWARSKKVKCPKFENVDWRWAKIKNTWQKVDMPLPRVPSSRLFETAPFEYVLKYAQQAVFPPRRPVVRRSPVLFLKKHELELA